MAGPCLHALIKGYGFEHLKHTAQVESDIPEMDDGLRCRSPSFSPDPDVISCRVTALEERTPSLTFTDEYE